MRYSRQSIFFLLVRTINASMRTLYERLDKDLISALVDCEADSDIIETLRDLGDQGRLGGWRIEPLDILEAFHGVCQMDKSKWR